MYLPFHNKKIYILVKLNSDRLVREHCTDSGDISSISLWIKTGFFKNSPGYSRSVKCWSLETLFPIPSLLSKAKCKIILFCFLALIRSICYIGILCTHHRVQQRWIAGAQSLPFQGLVAPGIYGPGDHIGENLLETAPQILPLCVLN